MATHSTGSTNPSATSSGSSDSLQARSGHKATSMAELMAKKQPSIKSFKKGENVPGTITKLTKSEILIDVGAKTEAQVLEKDKNILNLLLSSLKEGDSVTVSVLNPESDQGNPVVSLRRFIDGKQWQNLDELKSQGKVLDVLITSSTKGGFLVTSDSGISGFLPNSQANQLENPQNLVGKKIKAAIFELNKPTNKIIFSQKAAIKDADFSKAAGGFKSGQEVDTVVSSNTPFGIFVSIRDGEDSMPIEGFIHLSEISWDKIESAESYFKPGEKVKAQVIDVDRNAKRINLSLKRLTRDPFDEMASKFAADTKVKGGVKQKSSIGIVIDLGEGIDGFIRKEKIPPGSSYSVGDVVEATVSEIDARRRRIVLVPILKEKPIGYR